MENLIPEEMSRQSLIKADKDFYLASTKYGTGRAFIDFADDSVILLRQQQFPIIGKIELEKHYLNHENDKTSLQWEPTKAEVSPDGKLGFTIGDWIYSSIDKTGHQIKQYGNYITIWKKQSNGQWKYIADGGNSTPKPNNIK
ncbi:MAG: YybH family protein [Ignavibacteriaceae bacterium]